MTGSLILTLTHVSMLNTVSAGRPVSGSSKSIKSPVEQEKKKVIDPVTVLQQDWREYECKTWHLEPTVR